LVPVQYRPSSQEVPALARLVRHSPMTQVSAALQALSVGSPQGVPVSDWQESVDS